jgi:hypothetical protein
MTPVRLATVALLLCPIALFSQDQQGQSANGSSIVSAPQSKAPDTLSEPWRIIPPGMNLNNKLLQFTPRPGTEIASLDDSVCYKIRSYVVARDSKDSDSVHPVKYTTCQPASRYRLKTTEIHGSIPQEDQK